MCDGETIDFAGGRNRAADLGVRGRQEAILAPLHIFAELDQVHPWRNLLGGEFHHIAQSAPGIVHNSAVCRTKLTTVGVHVEMQQLVLAWNPALRYVKDERSRCLEVERTAVAANDALISPFSTPALA